jgi:hypothetical protein
VPAARPRAMDLCQARDVDGRRCALLKDHAGKHLGTCSSCPEGHQWPREQERPR